jgi:murein DD-endopeptidase MepM/ murein hydrolase activator NlpD
MALLQRFKTSLLVFLLAFGLLPVFVGCLGLSTVSAQEEETPTHGQAQQLRNRKEDLDSRRAEFRQKKLEKIRKARYHESALVQKQQQLYSSYQSLQQQQANKQQIQGQMGGLSNQIDKTIGQTTRLTTATSKRLRSIYMGGRLSWLELMFNAKTMNNMLDLLYYRKKVVQQDKELLGLLRTSTKQLKQEQNELQQKRYQLDATIDSIQSYQVQISQQVREESALRQKYLNDAAYYERLEMQLLAESASISRQLRSLSRVKKVAQSTGQLMWPLSGKLTSNFGYRMHPIHGRRIMHTGLDISRSTGTPIVAADGGQVFFAGWRGGYGKAVILNHGSKGSQNLATLYGHMSSIAVGSGQTVNKGQVIGYVGSTGHSTGPHLHFEVRVNGSPVNPLSYL